MSISIKTGVLDENWEGDSVPTVVQRCSAKLYLHLIASVHEAVISLRSAKHLSEACSQVAPGLPWGLRQACGQGYCATRHVMIVLLTAPGSQRSAPKNTETLPMEGVALAPSSISAIEGEFSVNSNSCTAHLLSDRDIKFSCWEDRWNLACRSANVASVVTNHSGNTTLLFVTINKELDDPYPACCSERCSIVPATSSFILVIIDGHKLRSDQSHFKHPTCQSQRPKAQAHGRN